MRVTLLPFVLPTVCLASFPVLAKQPQTAVEPRPQTAPDPPPATTGAANSEPAAAMVDSDDSEEEPTPPIPPASDSLGGHFTASALAALIVPFGELHDGLPQGDVLATGAGLGLELGFGVSRYVAVGIWGQITRHGTGSACGDCSTGGYALGPMVRYHLVQGVRFDPWISAGLGLAATTVKTQNQSLEFAGIELMRLQVGGDWYPNRHLGFGPLLELGAGLYTKLPDDTTSLGFAGPPQSGSPFYSFSLGARLTFDTPGK